LEALVLYAFELKDRDVDRNRVCRVSEMILTTELSTNMNCVSCNTLDCFFFQCDPIDTAVS